MADSPNVFQRLLAARKEVGYVQKNQKKIDGKYTAVMYSDVVVAVRESLTKHGIIDVVTVNPGWTVEAASTKAGDPLTRLQSTINTRFVNVDNPQDFVDYSCPAFGLDSGDKGPGKARTYGAKGNMIQAFLLISGDDEESRVENVPGVTQEAPPPILSQIEVDSILEKVTFAGTKKELDALYKSTTELVKGRKGKATDMKVVTEACSKRAGAIAEAVKKEADAERAAIQGEAAPVK